MELLVRPEAFTNHAATFGFEHLAFAVRKLSPGEAFSETLSGMELALVVLGGTCSVTSSAGEWKGIGKRATVFDGLPSTLYLPPDTAFTVTGDTACDLAFCYCKAEEHHPAHLVTPEEVGIEIRGGGNATRQINSMIPPAFPAHRLIVVEVFTPGGKLVQFSPA